jgi:VWFA-related protein
MNRTAISAMLALALLASATPSRGQAQPGPLPPKPGAAPEQTAPPQKRQRGVIHVPVNFVSTPVTVRDRSGELVFDLSATDFHIYDNGVEQKIEHFDLGGDPLSIVLLVENSSHVEPLLPAVRKSGIVFTQTVMGQTAEAAVIAFNDAADVLQPFTADKDQIQRTINRMPMGTSGVRLYDAMSSAVDLLQKQPENRRRVLLVISEAADSGSETRLGIILRRAQLANIAIYTIGLSTTAAELRAKPSQAGPPQIGPPGTFPTPGINGRPETPSMQASEQSNINLLALAVWVVQRAGDVVHKHNLAVASTATGGAHISTLRDNSIEKAMDLIGGELHAQYVLGYRPPGDEPSGYHEIKVTVSRPGVNVRTRPGYYLPAPTG